jgi:hypothetical protein
MKMNNGLAKLGILVLTFKGTGLRKLRQLKGDCK